MSSAITDLLPRGRLIRLDLRARPRRARAGRPGRSGIRRPGALRRHDIAAGPARQLAPGQPLLADCGMDGQPEALVDIDAITANVAALTRHVGAAQVMAVVKSDGYGHGMLPTARAALAGGATWLGVVHVADALALRAARA